MTGFKRRPDSRACSIPPASVIPLLPSLPLSPTISLDFDDDACNESAHSLPGGPDPPRQPETKKRYVVLCRVQEVRRGLDPDLHFHSSANEILLLQAKTQVRPDSLRSRLVCLEVKNFALINVPSHPPRCSRVFPCANCVKKGTSSSLSSTTHGWDVVFRRSWETHDTILWLLVLPIPQTSR